MKMMQKLKNNKYFLLICYVICALVSCQHKVVVPTKMKKIKAHFIGGIDGGYWFELSETRGDTVRFRLYNDYTLEKVIDADFVGEECSKYLSKEKWYDYINSYDGTNIYLKPIEKNKYLILHNVKTYYAN